MEQDEETTPPCCQTMEEATESGDAFSDVEDLKEHGISLPPTREDVHKLLEVYDEKYKKELYLFHANYNSKRTKDGKAGQINYKEIERVLLKEFNFYKLKSDPGKPYTNSRGEFLARISSSTSDEQTPRVDKLCQQIKQRLRSDPKMNVEGVHIKGSLAVDYGGAAETPMASCSTTATTCSTTATPTRQKRNRTRRLSPGQSQIERYFSSQGHDSTPHHADTSADMGYETQSREQGTQESSLPSPLTSSETNDD